MASIVCQTYRLPDQANSVETYIETLDDTKYLGSIVALDSSGKGNVWILSKT